MVSNKLTNRRRTARKPPVCHSGPAVGSILFPPEALQLKPTPLEKKLPGITSPIVPRTGRCPPPPPPPAGEITCSLIPVKTVLTFGEITDVEFFAYDTHYGQAQIIDVDLSTTGGLLEPPEGLPNGIPLNEEYTAGDNEGTFTLTATFSWPDNDSCIATAEITIRY